MILMAAKPYVPFDAADADVLQVTSRLTTTATTGRTTTRTAMEPSTQSRTGCCTQRALDGTAATSLGTVWGALAADMMQGALTGAAMAQNVVLC